MSKVYLRCLAVFHLVLTISVHENRYTHEIAYDKLEKNEIKVRSPGNCSDRQRKECVSLEGIRKEAIDGKNGVIELKRQLFINRNRVAGCETDLNREITVIGGTEVGKGSDEQSRSAGWILDLEITECLKNYIMKRFARLGGQNANQTIKAYKALYGNIYKIEGNKIEVQYVPVPNSEETNADRPSIAKVVTVSTHANTTPAETTITAGSIDDSKAPESNNDSIAIYVFLTAAVAIFLVVICGLALIFYRNWKARRERRNSFDPKTPLSMQSFNTPLNPDIEIKPQNLIFDPESEVIGRGNYGKVQIGQLKSGRPPIQRRLLVAVKSPLHGDDKEEIRVLSSEVIKLFKVGNHTNILKLYGVISKHMINNELYVCLEYCKHKSLREFLTKNQAKFGSEFDFSLLPKFACDIARGMAHLQSLGFIHGDIAARNLLVTENFVIKIADFGHAKDSPYYELSIQKSIPFRWSAIEVLENDAHYTPTVKPRCRAS